MKNKFFIISVISGLINISSYSQVSFGPQQVIDSLPSSFIHVHGGDLDDDGDNDIVASYQSSINWYRNNGYGVFSDSIIIDHASDCECVYLADIDGDNDLDVLASLVPANLIVYYQNDGNGNFSDRKVISDLVHGPHCVYAADLDGDGDNDVLSASVLDDKIAWYKNNGDGNFSDQIIVSATTDGASTVFAADIDGDNDNDIIAGGAWDYTLSWYENLDGLGTFGPSHIITNNVAGLQFAYAADLDGDMDNDVYFASFNDNKIAWFENDGSGNFGAIHLIYYMPKATDVCAQDFDNDGDLDIAATSDEGTLSWFENNGEGEFSDQIVLSTEDCRSVYCCDIDGDSENDIISASNYHHKLNWYKNLGIVGISERKFKTLSVFPNPTTKVLTVSGENLQSINLSNCQGQTIRNIKCENENISINLENEPKGLYFIKMVSHNMVQIEKIILQ